MANYKDPKRNQDQQDDDALSALYQASKKTGNTGNSNNGEDYIPEEIDSRILQAAKKAVTPEPGRVSFLRRRWDIPVSVAATIMLATLLFINVKDEIPHPDNDYLPKPSFDSPFMQEKEAEQVNSPLVNSSEPSRKREDPELRYVAPVPASPTPDKKDASIIDLPSSFKAEILSKQESEKIISSMPTGEANSRLKLVGEAKKSVAEPAGLPASEGNLQKRAEPSPPMMRSIANDKNKSDRLQSPSEQKSSDSSEPGIVRSDLPEVSGFPVKPSNREQWLKDIEQLLEDNKVEAAKLSFDRFRAAYPEYKLDNFCSQHRKLTCQ